MRAQRSGAAIVGDTLGSTDTQTGHLVNGSVNVVLTPGVQAEGIDERK